MKHVFLCFLVLLSMPVWAGKMSVFSNKKASVDAEEKTIKRIPASNEVTVELRYDGARVWKDTQSSSKYYPAYLGMTFEVDQIIATGGYKGLTCIAKTSTQNLKLKEGGMDSQYLNLLKIWELRDCAPKE